MRLNAAWPNRRWLQASLAALVALTEELQGFSNLIIFQSVLNPSLLLLLPSLDAKGLAGLRRLRVNLLLLIRHTGHLGLLKRRFSAKIYIQPRERPLTKINGLPHKQTSLRRFMSAASAHAALGIGR